MRVKLAPVLIVGAALHGCTPSQCGVVAQFVSLEQTLYKHAGVTISPYATSSPASGGVVISNCDPGDPNANMLKSEANACTPDTGDDDCVTCLKGSCCTESLAWFDGSNANGSEVVACVDAHCQAACPRPQ